MKRVFIALLLVFVFGCSDNKKPILGQTDFQKKLNADFKDATKSPLKDKDRKVFEGLDFFEFNARFVIQATLKRTPNSSWFDMKTTTDRVSKERIFGVLTFQIDDKDYQLNVYQGKDLMTTSGFEDYLFLPFLDDTNGVTTYGGGRYIDLSIPDGNLIELDFNKAYNPYCVYNEKFSCPIVPRVNYMTTKIEAGVKAYKKN